MELQENDLEQLIAQIAKGEKDVTQLQESELDQLMDFLHERAEELIGTEDDEVGQQLLQMLDLIGHVIDDRIEAEDNEKFTDAIQASIQRGNFYFELPTFMLH
jgi:hypothetical protein